MNYVDIQQLVSRETTALSVKHMKQVRDLRAEHKELYGDAQAALMVQQKQERQDLNNQHLERYREYREAPGAAASRAVEHNRDVQRKTIPDILRSRYNIEADTEEEFIEKIKARLKETTKTYRRLGNNPVERRRLEKGEDKLRQFIRTLGGSLKDVPFISAGTNTESITDSDENTVTMDNIDDILNAN